MKYTVQDESYNANPRRGYHNNRCVVTFERTPNGYVTENRQKEIVEAIRKLQSQFDMWCYPAKYTRVYSLEHPEGSKDADWHGTDVWEFEHGVDSGD